MRESLRELKHLLQTKVEPSQSAETKLVLCSGQLQRPMEETVRPSLSMPTPVVAEKVWILTHAFSVSVWRKVLPLILTEAENTIPVTSLELIRKVEVPHDWKRGLDFLISIRTDRSGL